MTFTLLKCRTVRHVFIVKFECIISCDIGIWSFAKFCCSLSLATKLQVSRHISPWDVDFWIADRRFHHIFLSNVNLLFTPIIKKNVKWAFTWWRVF